MPHRGELVQDECGNVMTALSGVLSPSALVRTNDNKPPLGHKTGRSYWCSAKACLQAGVPRNTRATITPRHPGRNLAISV